MGEKIYELESEDMDINWDLVFTKVTQGKDIKKISKSEKTGKIGDLERKAPDMRKRKGLKKIWLP
jgi:hypothetical protein